MDDMSDGIYYQSLEALALEKIVLFVSKVNSGEICSYIQLNLNLERNL
jgi:hypothetical protein